MQSQSKSQQTICKCWETDSKIYMEKKRPVIAKSILKKKKKSGMTRNTKF